MPSGYEWFIILGVVLLIFGGSQLPKLARNIGKAQKEFKDGLAEGAAEKPDSEKTPEELAAELAVARKEAADAKAQAAARTETPATTPPDPTSN
jgi:sec-independent protein translocase protein TatA